ncbi:hypothetical protein ATANTOWER_002725 [Ataeniobius toweri]|uniref:Uncharacterized protein n=1 Tax=Ataeniobius toweri TaxID=208326 RepID=A0ABU7CCW9_9TELE|nr:hypothetical protein [Ataeniobius toweri]
MTLCFLARQPAEERRKWKHQRSLFRVGGNTNESKHRHTRTESHGTHTQTLDISAVEEEEVPFSTRQDISVFPVGSLSAASSSLHLLHVAYFMKGFVRSDTDVRRRRVANAEVGRRARSLWRLEVKNQRAAVPTM